MHEPARLAHLDPVPHPLRHDDRLARTERVDTFDADGVLVAALFEDHVDATGYEEQQLVTVGMELAAMGRVARQLGRTDRVAVDADGRPGRGIDHGRGPVAQQRDHGTTEIERRHRPILAPPS